MSEVKRAAGDACAAQDAVGVVLLGLFVAVVALLAQRLEVGRVTEQRGLALVRLDVVDHRSGYEPAKFLMHSAQRVRLQLGHTQAPPGGCVVEVVVG